MHARKATLWPGAFAALLLATSAWALPITVKDPQGQPIATVMVSRLPQEPARVDTSDNGYPANGKTQQAFTELARFTDAQGRADIPAAEHPWKLRLRKPGYQDLTVPAAQLGGKALVMQPEHDPAALAAQRPANAWSSTLNLGSVHLSPQVLFVLGACAIMVAGLHLFFRATPVGREMRACAANRTAAQLCGISTRNMVTLSFMLSAGIGALAGCVMSPITYTQYDSGTALAIKGFTVAILGGLGNSGAAVAAGLLLGVIEAFSVSVVPLAFQDAIAITILLLILFVRPHGLFGSSEAARLKDF